MGCVLPCESRGELEHLSWAEANGAVTAFHAQPEVVFWNDNGTIRRHTPDLRVMFDDGRVELHEVKPLGRLNDRERSDLNRRTEALTPLLFSRGIHYAVIDSQAPEFQQRFRSAQAVCAARHVAPDAGLAALVREALLLRGVTTLGELRALLPTCELPALFSLCLARKLVISLDHDGITATTPIRLPRMAWPDSSMSRADSPSAVQSGQ
jgi:hypothetical protein